jgi:hypothetical protein
LPLDPARAKVDSIRMMRTLTFTVAVLATAVHAGAVPGDWKTYRSEQFGWELAYPPAMELKTYVGGASADLRDAITGSVLAELEVWPSDLCPRERPGTTAEAIGTQRAAEVTQADGADGSSSCGSPIIVRRSVSGRGVRVYEVGLTCTSERIVGHRAVHRREGRKEPTFFADVSQPWRKRVLLVDPVGVDPRMAAGAHAPAVASIRRVLETLATFAVPDPKVVCIEDIAPGAIAGTLAAPPSRK